ncbi:MAG TPA: CrcB family protein [Candidatus Dietzia intestinipullorum]|nr:CrcB family protein [Candidatus Dietzia intestinipullorum]
MRLPVALALVAVGGSAGTAARVVVSTLFPGQPLASTLAVNAAGAFALGLLVEVLDARRDTGRRHGARLVLGAGFCGGFTTYSLIAYQVADLTRGGDLHTAVTYGLATLVLGGVAAAGGMLLGITVRGSGHGRSRT